MIKTNKEKVIKAAVAGKIRQTCCAGYSVMYNGEVDVFPGIGGIVYNVKLGDSAYGWAGDHIEPGVSVYNTDKKDSDSMNILSCIGNEAIVFDGAAKGDKGFVTGKHGGAEDIIIYFPEETLEKLCVDDKILIKTYGQGLKLEDYEDIKLQSIDPELFLKLEIEENNDGTITVPVVATVPPYLMGSGTGSNNAYRGDYDIMTADKEVIKEFGLDKLRFGDIVLLEDCDNVYGRGYLKNSVSIGVVVHSDCVLSGHGPGIVTIMACQKPLIKGKICPDANIAKYMEI